MTKMPYICILLLCCALSSAADDDVLVPMGSVWSYFEEKGLPAADWKTVEVPADGWGRGASELGFGDKDEATQLTRGRITYYFRRTVDAPDVHAFNSVKLKLIRDDGAVIYLNGREWVRANMPPGEPGPGTLAASAVTDNAVDHFHLPNTLRPGTNTIAVEIHQCATTSSDISFNLELKGSSDNLPSTSLLRGPYLQMVTSTGIVVRWRTSTPCGGVVRYGESRDAMTQVVSTDEPTTEHEVFLTDLTPTTDYIYSVGTPDEILAGGDELHWFRTAPPVGTRQRVRIWAIGDGGTGNEGAKSVARAYQSYNGDRHTDVWLMLGDNAYTHGTDQEYQRNLFTIYTNLLPRTALWATIGNHEERTADSDQQTGAHYENFTHPTQGEAGGVASGTEAYYAFNYANIHFICLNSMMDDLSTNSAQYAWLAGDLEANVQEWTIVFWHHVPYSKGTHDSDTEDRHIQMRENFLPLLEAHGVDLVLGGHSHVYERSYLLHGHYGHSSTLKPSMILDNGTGNPRKDHPYKKPGPEGAVYVVAGNAGSTANNFGLNHPAMVSSVAELGSVVIDVTGDILMGRFLDNAGNVDDLFVIRHPGE